MDGNTQNPLTVEVRAAGAADADRELPGPVSLWFEMSGADGWAGPTPIAVDDARLVHLGPPGDPAAPDADGVIDRSGCVLLPGLVNAHAHLDLTGLGPRPHDPDRGFVPWVDMIRTERPTAPGEIDEAIRLGARLSLAGGVVAVGDILGAAGGRPTTAGLGTLAVSPLRGVGFVECFGIGSRTASGVRALDSLAEELRSGCHGLPCKPCERPGGQGLPFGPNGGTHFVGEFRAGLQPHAPNTVSLGLYRHCVELAGRLNLPLATHLAETAEERLFIAEGRGPQRELLERLGIWDDRECAHIGHGKSPVAHLAGVLGSAPFLVAHVNDADDAAIDTLARTNTSVAYCPRASAYFDAPGRLGPHRYREMLRAGVNVCLGTDSIVNLDTPGRISVLDDARLLRRRDGVDGRTLIKMMTTNGAAALGLDPAGFLLKQGGRPFGVVAVPVEEAESADGVLNGTGEAELLFYRIKSV